MVLHQAFRARHVRKTGIGGEVRHGVTSDVSCETSSNKHATPHLHREYDWVSTKPDLKSKRLVNHDCHDLLHMHVSYAAHVRDVEASGWICAEAANPKNVVVSGPRRN